MGLRRRVVREKTATSESRASGNNYLDDIMPFIKKGTVIPILSNSMRIEQIFRDEKSLTDQISDTAEFYDEDLTIDEQLTKEWADEIHYPMADDHSLARVAQFYQVEQKESLLAKTKYLKFLTNYLLDVNVEEEGYQDVVRQMRTRKRSSPRSSSNWITQIPTGRGRSLAHPGKVTTENLRHHKLLQLYRTGARSGKQKAPHPGLLLVGWEARRKARAHTRSFIRAFRYRAGCLSPIWFGGLPANAGTERRRLFEFPDLGSGGYQHAKSHSAAATAGRVRKVASTSAGLSRAGLGFSGLVQVYFEIS